MCKMSLPVLVSSPLTAERTHAQSCREHAQRTRNENKYGMVRGRRLWRQMLVGFICAACLGVIMLILGSVFIGNAIKGNMSITVMLCVLGMVCGLIILVGTAILGRVLCSRKFCADDEQHLNRHRPEACLHACSIIYTPSQDQLNGPGIHDPPPAYEMVIFPRYHAVQEDSDIVGSIEVNNGTSCVVQPVIMSPPKYSIASVPLPKYGDQV